MGLSLALWRRRALARTAVSVVASSLVLAASGKVQVPSWPVPVTLQSLVVLLIGVALGLRAGIAAVALFLLEGLVGLPVFAGAGAGPTYMAGPTGGYLAGFLASVAVVGLIAERTPCWTVWRALGAITVGHLALFVPGVLWLAMLLGSSRAVAAGITPFLVPTVVKTLLGTAIVVAVPLARLRPQVNRGGPLI